MPSDTEKEDAFGGRKNSWGPCAGSFVGVSAVRQKLDRVDSGAAWHVRVLQGSESEPERYV